MCHGSVCLALEGLSCLAATCSVYACGLRMQGIESRVGNVVLEKFEESRPSLVRHFAKRVFCRDSAVSSTLFSCLQTSSTVPVTVLPSSASSMLTEQGNSEHFSFSMPRRACQDVSFVVCD